MDIKDNNITLSILASLMELQPGRGWYVYEDCKLLSRDGQCLYIYPSQQKIKYWENITCHYLVKELQMPITFDMLKFTIV